MLLLTYVASYAVRRDDELRSDFKGFIKPRGAAGRRRVLLLLEPDFGAATVLLATGFAVLFLAGARIRTCWCRLVLGVAAMAALRGDLALPHAPPDAFLDPWADPFDSGFQLTQSLIAIGRGEWFGVGLGASVQKLFYLPEAHTDFLFAVLAEELGLVGVVRGARRCSRCWSWRALAIARRGRRPA